jgi:hypothetical protein
MPVPVPELELELELEAGAGAGAGGWSWSWSWRLELELELELEPMPVPELELEGEDVARKRTTQSELKHPNRHGPSPGATVEFRPKPRSPGRSSRTIGDGTLRGRRPRKTSAKAGERNWGFTPPRHVEPGKEPHSAGTRWRRCAVSHLKPAVTCAVSYPADVIKFKRPEPSGAAPPPAQGATPPPPESSAWPVVLPRAGDECPQRMAPSQNGNFPGKPPFPQPRKGSGPESRVRQIGARDPCHGHLEPAAYWPRRSACRTAGQADRPGPAPVRRAERPPVLPRRQEQFRARKTARQT